MRIMAIDYGDAHTGVALSDPTGFLVGTTTTINSWRQEVVLGRLLELIEEHRPDEVVLGFPKNMDGTDGRKADLYRELAEIRGLDITASGGVSSNEDLRQLGDRGLYAAIVGKAWYAGAVDLALAVREGGPQ